MGTRHSCVIFPTDDIRVLTTRPRRSYSAPFEARRSPAPEGIEFFTDDVVEKRLLRLATSSPGPRLPRSLYPIDAPDGVVRGMRHSPCPCSLPSLLIER
jgi:hypothetical protein